MIKSNNPAILAKVLRFLKSFNQLMFGLMIPCAVISCAWT